jgi:DNA-3-methyladenine glycosylase I
MIDFTKQRCRWCGSDPLLIRYHDEEWGNYARDDREYQYFEKMALEIFQAGLSWRTILHKREHFREAFDGFDVDMIAKYDEAKITQLLGNQGIVRNRMKIEAVIYNAREIIRLRQQYGSFAKYLAQLDTENVAEVYKEFKRRFRFMGPTVTESFLQTVGKMPVAHEPQCWLYRE